MKVRAQLPSVRIEIREADILSERASGLRAPSIADEDADPIDVLFDVMEDLDSAETAVEAGAVCLASLVRAIPSHAGIVHLFDPDAHELVAVYAMGPRSERLVLTRTEDSDFLISAAIRKHEPIVTSYGKNGTAPRPPDRHFLLDAKKDVIVCPVIDGTRLLGVIELVDSKRPRGFDKPSEHAMQYVADRYAGFLAEHGVVINNVVPPPSGFIR